MGAIALAEFYVKVRGRPAPQGSKQLGAAGQMREQSLYLPPWRAAIKEAVYRQYKLLGIAPDDLPLMRGPVAVGIVFLVADSRPQDPPDLDKLCRGVWDALTAARVWEDDARVTECWAQKRWPNLGADEHAGAYIHIRPGQP